MLATGSGVVNEDWLCAGDAWEGWFVDEDWSCARGALEGWFVDEEWSCACGALEGWSMNGDWSCADDVLEGWFVDRELFVDGDDETAAVFQSRLAGWYMPAEAELVKPSSIVSADCGTEVCGQMDWEDWSAGDLNDMSGTEAKGSMYVFAQSTFCVV